MAWNTVCMAWKLVAYGRWRTCMNVSEENSSAKRENGLLGRRRSKRRIRQEEEKNTICRYSSVPSNDYRIPMLIVVNFVLMWSSFLYATSIPNLTNYPSNLPAFCYACYHRPFLMHSQRAVLPEKLIAADF